MHPGDHETIDTDKCVELELLFNIGRCAGIRNGVKERVSPSDVDFATETVKTCGPFTAAAVEGAIKLKHLYGKHCRLMCFIGRLVAKMGSEFLLEELMESTELHVVVVGVESSGFVAQTKVVAVLRKLNGSGLFALLVGRDYTLLSGGSHVDTCRWRLCARERGSSSLRLEA